MTQDAAEIAKGLTSGQRAIVLRAGTSLKRAGDLAGKYGRQWAQGWLRETPLIERQMWGGNLGYRLTPLGLSVRRYLQEHSK